MPDEENKINIKYTKQKMAIHFCVVIFCLFIHISSEIAAQSVGAYDLINLINGMRSANGLRALSVDSALMACAQSTAETMAASHMSWHIGNVAGRASSFGYNNYNRKAQANARKRCLTLCSGKLSQIDPVYNTV